MNTTNKNQVQLEIPQLGRKRTTRKGAKLRYIKLCEEICNEMQNVIFSVETLRVMQQHHGVTNTFKTYLYQNGVLLFVKRGLYKLNPTFQGKGRQVGEMIYRYARADMRKFNEKNRKINVAPAEKPAERKNNGGKQYHTEHMIKILRSRGYVIFRNPFASKK